MPGETPQDNNQDPLNLFGGDSHIGSSIQELQGQIDRQAQLSQNIIFGVLIAFVFITVTVAIEVVLFHSNGVSEEEYINALDNHKAYTELLIDNKISELKDSEPISARDTIEPKSEND